MSCGDVSRVVLHVDIDAFFVQVCAFFLQKFASGIDGLQVECHRNPLLDASMPIAVQQHQDIISVRCVCVCMHTAV